MKNQADYSLYKCPYSHIEKDCGHELHGPEGYENTYGVWCACGFRGPVLCLDPSDLKLEKKDNGIVTVKRLYEEEKKANKTKRVIPIACDLSDYVTPPES